MKALFFTSDFTVQPRSINATKGSVVTFYCVSIGAPVHSWYLNGISIFRLPPSQLTGVSKGNEYNSEGDRLFYLRLVAQPIFNNSAIQCQANSVFTAAAILKVQGAQNFMQL
jgi:hypothetical protein